MKKNLNFSQLKYFLTNQAEILHVLFLTNQAEILHVLCYDNVLLNMQDGVSCMHNYG